MAKGKQTPVLPFAIPRAGVTVQEIDAIIAHAQNAPLRNMQEAAAVSALLQRFRAWAVGVLEPAPAKEPSVPAGTSEATVDAPSA